jgi:hypothetical protein
MRRGANPIHRNAPIDDAAIISRDDLIDDDSVVKNLRHARAGDSISKRMWIAKTRGGNEGETKR